MAVIASNILPCVADGWRAGKEKEGRRRTNCYYSSGKKFNLSTPLANRHALKEAEHSRTRNPLKQNYSFESAAG